MQIFSKKKLMMMASVALLLGAGLFHSAHAATATWTGTADSNWSNGSNWTGGTGTGGIPGPSDVATFGSCSANCSPTISTTTSVGGISITASYTGTITQATGASITIGGSGYSQAAGIFVGSSNASDTITVNGNFSQTGGTFTAPAGNLTVSGNISLSAGTFNANNGTVTINEPSGSGVSIACGATSFNQVVIAAAHSGLTVGAGCTLPLGYNPSTSIGPNVMLNNNGIITASGTWNFYVYGCGYQGVASVNNGTITVNGNIVFQNSGSCDSGDIQNYGTITVTGSWTGGGMVNETSGAVFTYNGTSSISIALDFNIALGTAPNNLTVTVSDGGGGLGAPGSSLGCSATNYFKQVNVAAAYVGLTVNSGCTVPLGFNPSTSIGPSPMLTNNGIITASGTWNFYVYGCGYQGTTSSNNGTITVNGSIVFQNSGSCDAGDILNYGTLTVTGSWTGGGMVNENSGAVFTYNGTSSISISHDFNIATGTAPNNLTVTVTNAATGISLAGSSLGCSATNYFKQVVVAASAYGLTVNSGCTVPLGFNPTTVIGPNVMLTNNGFITASGTWNFNAYGCGFQGTGSTNNGTITINGSMVVQNTGSCDPGDLLNYGTVTVTGSWTGGGLVNENTSAMFNFANGITISVPYDFNIAPGTTTSSGINLSMIAGASPTNASLAPGSSTFSSITINKSGNTVTWSYAATSTLDTGNFSFQAGSMTFPGSTYTLNVQGNFSNTSGNTFGNSNLTLGFTGAATSTIYAGSGTFSANLAVNKTGIIPVQLTWPLSVGGTCTVTAGTLDMNNNNLGCTGAVSVSYGGWLADYAGEVTTLTLGSTVTNNGVIFLDGAGPSCVSPYPQLVQILSSASGTQRSWSGSGEFIVRSAYVKDQIGTAAISVWNGTLIHGGGSWSIPSGVGRPQLVESTGVSPSHSAPVTLPAFTYWPRSTDLIIVAVSASNGETITAPTDNASNTYRLATSASYGSPSNGVSLYYAQNANTTSSFVVQLNGTGGGYLSGAAYEFTGMAASGTYDNATTMTDPTGVGSPLSSGYLTAKSSQDMLAFGLATVGTTGNTVASGTGWTGLANVSSAGGSPGLSPEYESFSGNPGSINASWTAGATTTYGALISVFDPPGSAGTSFAASGTLDSSIFDTKSVNGAQLNSVTWYGSQPAGTSVGFQFAVATSSAGPWNYEGPSGDGTQYFGKSNISPGVTIPLVSNIGGAGYAMFNGYRYFRYRTVLFSDPSQLYTPTVTGVNVNWSP